MEGEQSNQSGKFLEFDALNSIQHANMFERLERITWLIEVVQDDEVVRRVAGFSVHAHLIMSSADRFRDIDENDTSVKIRARLRKDNVWAPAELVFMMERWDIILFKVSSSLAFEGARFVSDGTLSENQTLFHMGHQMPWTYHVSHVCSPCVENVILPSRFSEMTCERKIPSSSEKFPTYPVMGHVWNREFYENYHKEHGNHLDFARDFHAHVPIIQLTGFSSRVEDLGGPIINTSGEIVGMFAGSGSQCVGIHVTALKEFLKYYNGSFPLAQKLQSNPPPKAVNTLSGGFLWSVKLLMREKNYNKSEEALKATLVKAKSCC